MGFEMLGSRYLNPYFGGAITTWAALISVVLLAMMIGYLSGGYIADAYPRVPHLSAFTGFAGLSIVTLPWIADPMMLAVLDTLGDGMAGVLLASMALMFVPVAMISACSPFVVRLLLKDLKQGGKTSGWVYGVSTLGNVFGTLVTVFFLIPSLGTRTITLCFGICLLVLALCIYLLQSNISRGLVKAAVAGIIALLVLPASQTRAEVQITKLFQASYPEGPLWFNGLLLVPEMYPDQVSAWDGKRKTVFWKGDGCGPTSISVYQDTGFIVTCHLAGKLVHLSARGELRAEMNADADGAGFQDPNDSTADGEGGVFFTDAGAFSADAPATGVIYHVSKAGAIRKVADGFSYANGITFNPVKRQLLVSEHIARKVWAFTFNKTMDNAARSLFLDTAPYIGADNTYALSGPDGIEVDNETGATIIAQYGDGSLLLVCSGGTVRKIPAMPRFVTNIAFNGEKLAVTGSHINDRPPFSGDVLTIKLSQADKNCA